MTGNHRILLLLALVGGSVIAACGGDDYASKTTAVAATATAPASGAVQSSPSQAGSAGAVRVKDTSSLGKVLAASDGMTLYTFNNDTAGKSSCSGACAGAWPPLTVTTVPAKPDGVSGDFSLVNRDDGQKQLALNGKPLYRYAADKDPADTNGEGVGGVWFAAKVSAATGAATPASNPGAYGY